MPAEEARRRLKAQMPAAQMAAEANLVIDTNGSYAETGLQVVAGWVELGLALPAPEVRAAEIADADGIAAILNAVVREGGLTALDRTYTPAEERAYLRGLPDRSVMTLARVGIVTAGFQIVEPYAAYTGAMDHVATVGTYVVASARGHGLGAAMSTQTFNRASAMGFTKLVAAIRADNAAAQVFYEGLGFRPCGRLARQVATSAGAVDQLLYELFL
jgi:L-amino acid N-acyltransferase YncA